MLQDIPRTDYHVVLVLQAIGDAYLKVQDVNVVYVDWTDGSLAIYSQAVANTRLAGLEVARFINWLKEHTGHSPSHVHVIGHSLGSHVAGGFILAIYWQL